MTDAEQKGWKPLKLASKVKHPCLFYSYESSKSTLLLQLTDLALTWRCSLSKAEVISEASKQHCSIDPSESTDQFNVFLSKLGHSVEEGNNILAVEDDKEKSCLLFRTQCSLPRPLQPLAFTFSLDLETSAEFSQRIVLPLLSSLSVQDSQLKSLEDQIKAKDHVIAKLLDRIGTQGVDMSIIFPALTGAGGRKGNVTIELAKKRVTGMEKFDHDSWLKEFAGQNDDVARLKELIAGVQQASTSTDRNYDWVSQLPGRDVLEKANASQASIRASQLQSQIRSQQVQKSDDETASEDDFERQATPPTLKKNKMKSRSPGNNPEISGSSENSAAEDSPPPKRRKTGTIRGIGGRKPPTKSKPAVNSSSSPVTAEPALASHRIETSDTDTASTSDTEKSKPTKQQPQKPKLGGLRSNTKRTACPNSPQKSCSPPAARPTSSHASTPSHLLGRIGNAHHRTTTTSPLPEAKISESLEAPTPSRRLGRIGIKRKKRTPSPVPVSVPDNAEPNSPSTASSTASDDDDLDGPITTKTPNKKSKPPPTSSPDKTPHPPPHHNSEQSKPPKSETELHSKPTIETEEEKASRKKAELRKTIASGPAKKKHRF